MKTKTISNNYKLQIIEYQPSFTAICSLGDNRMYGKITISYQPTNDLLEFESFEKWLEEVTQKPTYAEELCYKVYEEIKSALGNKTAFSVVVHVAQSKSHGPVTVSMIHEPPPPTKPKPTVATAPGGIIKP